VRDVGVSLRVGGKQQQQKWEEVSLMYVLYNAPLYDMIICCSARNSNGIVASIVIVVVVCGGVISTV